MNNNRRKIIEMLISQVEDIQGDLEELIDEEENAFKNMPESLQQTEEGGKIESCIDSLESAIASLEDTVNYLQESIE